MIDRLLPFLHPSPLPGDAPVPANRHKVLRMVMNERTAGSMPMWDVVDDNHPEGLSTGDASSDQNSLANSPIVKTTKEDEFGFADLLDMVNPLQHIPIVGHFYREITGDQIKPSGRIIGGAVFGGAIGLASGLVNVIMEKETGRDIPGNAFAFLRRGEMPHLVNNAPPVARDLPGELLAFTDLSYKSDDSFLYAEPKRPVWERG
jgi:hypothetical protein